MGAASVNGPLILVEVEPGYTLILGGGGERIVYHRSAESLPKKYQLYLHYTDGTYLTVTVQGWGSAFLLETEQVPQHKFINLTNPSPLSDAFSADFFHAQFEALKPDDSRSVKFFMISKPGVLGVGNGYLQDILWQARIHPRRRAVSLTHTDQQALYAAIRAKLQEMVDGGGRDGDFDLFDHPGGYKRILCSKTVGQPCQNCGTPIEKAAYLGGAVYFCPKCQV